MQNLFGRSSTAAQGIMGLPADWLYIKHGLLRNLSMVIKFYRRNPMAVKSDHFLIRLLQSINVPHSQNIERYYNNVDAVSLNVSMMLKMTSSIFKGQLFNGIFYGPGNDEILIAHNESFDPFEADAKWENLCPVKILRHPKTDLGLNLPDGINNSDEKGLVVVSINIPLLAIQYRAFRLNEAIIAEEMNNLNTDINDEFCQRSIMQFIHMYVLPNALASHLDYAIFNRIKNIANGLPLSVSDRKHSFYTTDFSSKINYVHETIIDNLHKVGKDFVGTLRSIPMVVKDSSEQIFKLPDMALTRQVLWATVIAELPVLSFLFNLAKDGVGVKNQSEVNRIMRYMLAYKSDSLFKSMLPYNVYVSVMTDINEITSKTDFKM